MASLSKAVEDMFYAAVIGSVEMLKKGLKEGWNINQADDDGSTPLMLAAVNGQKDAVDFLLKNGADASRKDVDGWDAAKLAENAGYAEIAKMIEGYKGKKVESGEPPSDGLEEIAIVAFVQEKASEITERLNGIRSSKGSDEKAVDEANHLNILLFAEANSFYKNLDKEVRVSINETLGRLNDTFSDVSKELGRPVYRIDISSVKDYDISRLLNEDEKVLKRITQDIYKSIVSFASEELKIDSSEFSVKYGQYHKRLMAMREALLDSLRSTGTEQAEKVPKIGVANIIGKPTSS